MNFVVIFLMFSFPTHNIDAIRKLKKSVKFMRIWADGEPDQHEIYQYTHNLLKKNNITDDTFIEEE